MQSSDGVNLPIPQKPISLEQIPNLCYLIQDSIRSQVSASLYLHLKSIDKDILARRLDKKVQKQQKIIQDIEEIQKKIKDIDSNPSYQPNHYNKPSSHVDIPKSTPIPGLNPAQGPENAKKNMPFPPKNTASGQLVGSQGKDPLKSNEKKINDNPAPVFDPNSSKKLILPVKSNPSSSPNIIPGGKNEGNTSALGTQPNLSDLLNNSNTTPVKFTPPNPQASGFPGNRNIGQGNIPPLNTGLPTNALGNPSGVTENNNQFSGNTQAANLKAIPSQGKAPPLLVNSPNFTGNSQPLLASPPLLTGSAQPFPGIFPPNITGNPQPVPVNPPNFTGNPQPFSGFPPNLTGNPQLLPGTISNVTGNPPPLQANPPPLQVNPPPLQATPPPLQATPPLLKATPPLLKANPPPLQANPPPLQATPPPLQANPPPLQATHPPQQANPPPQPANPSLLNKSPSIPNPSQQVPPPLLHPGNPPKFPGTIPPLPDVSQSDKSKVSQSQIIPPNFKLNPPSITPLPSFPTGHPPVPSDPLQKKPSGNQSTDIPNLPIPPLPGHAAPSSVMQPPSFTKPQMPGFPNMPNINPANNPSNLPFPPFRGHLPGPQFQNPPQGSVPIILNPSQGDNKPSPIPWTPPPQSIPQGSQPPVFGDPCKPKSDLQNLLKSQGSIPPGFVNAAPDMKPPIYGSTSGQLGLPALNVKPAKPPDFSAVTGNKE